MTLVWIGIALALIMLGWLALVGRRTHMPAQVRIVDPDGRPRFDAEGAARSVQAAELTLPAAELERLWSFTTLEQLARTYWIFLSRVTLGIIRVVYTEHSRAVVLVSRRIVLLGFDAPEYELDGTRGMVRWRIRRGLLVSRRGREAGGALAIDVRQMEAPGPGVARLHVEVGVISFYPAIASAFGRRLYTATQSTIHVLVTHAFLRSLARLELAPSKTGRYPPT